MELDVSLNSWVPTELHLMPNHQKKLVFHWWMSNKFYFISDLLPPRSNHLWHTRSANIWVFNSVIKMKPGKDAQILLLVSDSCFLRNHYWSHLCPPFIPLFSLPVYFIADPLSCSHLVALIPSLRPQFSLFKKDVPFLFSPSSHSFYSGLLTFCSAFLWPLFFISAVLPHKSLLCLAPFRVFPFYSSLVNHYSTTAAALQTVTSPPTIRHIPLSTSDLTFPSFTQGITPPPNPWGTLYLWCIHTTWGSFSSLPLSWCMFNQ